MSEESLNESINMDDAPEYFCDLCDEPATCLRIKDNTLQFYCTSCFDRMYPEVTTDE